ncbi:MAG: Gfo/Idh/MocA family oxidoreductase [Thermoguttaceae bacterium]
MAQDRVTCNAPASSRRDFLKTASALAAAGTMAGGLSIARGAHAAGSDVLRIGLIGCGGRGTGAAANAIGADKNCKLVALADAFSDRLDSSLRNLKKAAEQMEAPQKVAVDKDHCFVGLDAADKLIQSDVDVVLLAEPPHFRPMHLKAAIDAGKHVFCEKPVAVDAQGVRSVLASAEQAKKKNLSLVSGLCWRYDQGVMETMKRVHDGAIGEIRSIQVTYMGGPLSPRDRKPDWTEMQYQLRNWQYFVWLSGDFNAEQHVHSLDKAAWAMKDATPKRAWGLGGCLLRDRKAGDVYDHHAVTYEYDNGVHVHAYCRQMPGCFNDVSDVFVGTKGRAVLPNYPGKPYIEGENAWKFKGITPLSQAYDEEHRRLFASIRAGQALNNGEYMAKSTMWAVIGRLADYTGQRITWDKAMNSQENLTPAAYAFDAEPPTKPDKDGVYPIALPGVTKLVVPE